MDGRTQQDLFNGEYSINQPDVEWNDMPEYIMEHQPEPLITAKFKFRTEEDYLRFNELVKKHIYDGKKVFDGMQRKDEKQAWYPHIEKFSKYYYINSYLPDAVNPVYPVYIVSKNRTKRNPTSKVLMNMDVPFKMVVEKPEYDDYCRLVGQDNVLILPERYKSDYDRFWKDDDERTGPGPARNFAWEHSMDNGHRYHWVMDDNIEWFERVNKNKKVKCADGTIFNCAEQFVDRYENIAVSGLQYSKFLPWSDARPPFKLNTRIYSCLLIRNDIPYRWRGRYNEDTDLSLRALKDGWCTVQFNAFLQEKRATRAVSGGNTEEFYENEGTLNKSQMLVDMHPDVTSVAWKFNRWHHHVDYSPFKANKLIRKNNTVVNIGVNDFGMEIIKKEE